MPRISGSSIIFFLLAILVIMLPACGDDPSNPRDFSVTLMVHDEAGMPVAGVAVQVMPGLPSMVWPRPPNSGGARPMVTIPFILNRAMAVQINVLDVAGSRVRTFERMDQPAGSHTYSWDGRDESGDVITLGYYRIVLLIDEIDGSNMAAVDNVGVLMADLDPEQYSYGSTDAQGKLTIRDRKIVPAFWSPSPLDFTEDSSDVLGVFELTTETWFYCTPPYGRSSWGVLEADDGPNNLIVTISNDKGDRSRPASTAPLQPTELAEHRDETAYFNAPYSNPFN